jgi:gluconate 2-dehydrogenase gamma chain
MHWTPDLRAVLCAVMDRIIPTDEFPGASDVGCEIYIERIFETDLAHKASVLEQGLNQLRQIHFESLAPDQQDAHLTTIESSEFFRLLVQTTSEGYYSDPGNGGNKDQIAWKMIGWDPKGQTT